MPLTSAYWPVPFTSVVQSVFMVVLLLSRWNLRAEDERLRPWLEFITAALLPKEATSDDRRPCGRRLCVVDGREAMLAQSAGLRIRAFPRASFGATSGSGTLTCGGMRLTAPTSTRPCASPPGPRP